MNIDIAVRAFLRIAAIAILTLMLSALSTLAQEPGGTHFVVSFPDTTTNKLDVRYPNTRVAPEASLWIYSAVKNKVVISNNGGARTVLNLDAGKITIYKVPSTAQVLVDVSGTPVAKSLDVEADYPVILYCYLATIQGGEAWRPISVDQWGTTYTVAAAPGEVVQDIGTATSTDVPHTPKAAPSEILVIAAHDNTNVTLTPQPGTNFDGGAPHTITLNEGEVYQVQSRVNISPDAEEQEDLGSTFIIADKPIGVISGNTRAMIDTSHHGIVDNAFKNTMLEWLSPLEELGTEFVYMPTVDDHRAGSRAPRVFETIRLYSSVNKTTTGSFTIRDSLTQVVTTGTFSIKRDSLVQIRVPPNDAVHITTSYPVQAMISSSAAVQAEIGDCPHGTHCVGYMGTAPYMVTMVPRERWSSFAPFYTPGNPGGMKHYIDVVTDSSSMGKIMLDGTTPFSFTKPVPGTDLVWGTMALTAGAGHTLSGTNGARFSGYVYGLFNGAEEMRTMMTRKRDGGASPQSGPVSSLVPAEYEEYNAISYGYPLASSDAVIAPSDTLRIDSSTNCSTLTLDIRALNANPVGLRSVALDPASVVNAKIVAVNPPNLGDIVGQTQVTLKVMPIDPLKKASGTVLITDRTGKVWYVYFNADPDVVTFTPSDRLDYGTVALNSTTSKSVTITNPLARPVVVNEIRIVPPGEGFTITGTNPDGPAHSSPVAVNVPPGGTITVDVGLAAAQPNHVYSASLQAILACDTLGLQLAAIVSGPASADDAWKAGGYWVSAAMSGSAATMRYHLAMPGNVRIAIYNASGSVVATLPDRIEEAGEHAATWDASEHAAGIYFCVIESGAWRRAVPFIVVR
jgi:hypothetical protein